ncbi:MAG: hypothetical protein DRP79_04825 [Planctomycetota bacterium]|nr:MAG: hypothetical protein DRP79_04825 [Planctomycetota bacterium]
MKHVFSLLAIVVLAAGCNGGPPIQPGNGGTQKNGDAVVKPSDNDTRNGDTEEPSLIPKPEIPVADGETQKKIDAAIAKVKDASAKMEERQDALLVDMVKIGAIAAPDVLRLTLDPEAGRRYTIWAQKFFRLLPEKDALDILVRHLFHEEAEMRAAANAMLVVLTGKKDIGYDANADETSRYEAIEKWMKVLGTKNY